MLFENFVINYSKGAFPKRILHELRDLNISVIYVLELLKDISDIQAASEMSEEDMENYIDHQKELQDKIYSDISKYKGVFLQQPLEGLRDAYYQSNDHAKYRSYNVDLMLGNAVGFPERAEVPRQKADSPSSAGFIEEYDEYVVMSDEFNSRYPNLANTNVFGGIRGRHVELDFSFCASLMNEIVLPYINQKQVDIDAIVIKVSKEVNLGTLQTLDDLLLHGVKILDTFLMVAIKNHGISWSDIRTEVVNGRKPLIRSDAYKCVFCLWAMIVLRGSAEVLEGQKLPAITKSINILKDFEEKEYNEMLGDNQMGCFLENWIRAIAVTSIPPSFRARARQGICGTRVWNILRTYNPDLVGWEKDSTLVRVYSLVCKVSRAGPFWEMHPAFCPSDLEGKPVKSNLNAMLFSLYNSVTINSIKEASKLRIATNFRHQDYTWWKEWNETTFASYRNEVIPSQLEVANTRVRNMMLK